MTRIAYVNGRYSRMADASVSIEDRGFQLADSVYEAVTLYRGHLIDLGPHMDRLERSLEALEMRAPMGRAAIAFIMAETVRRNHLRDGFIYLQISRGQAKRDHAFPVHSKPSLIIYPMRLDFEAIAARAKKGIAVASQKDIRWGRCDIKATSLLPNVLAKQAARSAGAFEAVLYDENGFVTEGASTNIWMIDQEGTLITRPVRDNILAGITRARTIELAKALQIRICERPFSLEEAKNAQELFLTSSTSAVMPITQLDHALIKEGKPGPISQRLRAIYMDYMDDISDRA